MDDYKINKETGDVELAMMHGYTDDFITLKPAERKRKKRYKKLPEIYKQAFAKSIFETEYACYNHKFEPLYLHKSDARGSI